MGYCSFISLAAQYDSCVRSGSVHLTVTQEGPAFVSTSRMRRIFDSVFHKYSFDLVAGSKALLSKISVTDVTTEEIPALFRVMNIARRMLKESTKSFETDWEAFQKKVSYDAFVSAFDFMVERIAQERGTTKIRLLLEQGSVDCVYRLVRDRSSLFDEEPGRMEGVLQKAFDKRDDNVILFLIQNGVSVANVRGVSVEYFSSLGNMAYSKDLDRTLAHLVKENRVGNELYFTAASSGLVASTKAFLGRGQVPTCDGDGNTVMHHAFLSRNIELMHFLFERYDPTVLNNRGETPLQYFLNRAEATAETKNFLQAILAKRGEDFQKILENVADSVGGVLLRDVPCDCFELFYLLQRPLSELTAAHVTREDIDASFPCIAKKYPQGNLYLYYLTAFVVNKDHLKTGLKRHYLSLKESCSIEFPEIKKLFSKLDWKVINLKKFYEEVFEVTPEEDTDPFKELNDQLDTFITRVQKREVFLGTPRHGDALINFYAHIDLALRCCVARLIEINKPEVTIAFFKEILLASRYCGSRYFQTAINLYLLICKEVEETLQGYFDRLFADYRRICFEGVVGDLNEGSVHAVINASVDLGEELGIPGASLTFDDSYSSEQYNKSDIRKTFFEKAYTPASIVFDCLLQTCEHDSIAREKYIDIQKKLMPVDFCVERYTPIHEAIKKIPRKIGLQERRRREDEILLINEIGRNGKETAEEAIENAKKSSYLESFVYNDQGKRQVKAAIYLLERMGVISCALEWKDMSKKIIPVERQEPYKAVSLLNLFRRLTGFIVKILSKEPAK